MEPVTIASSALKPAVGYAIRRLTRRTELERLSALVAEQLDGVRTGPEVQELLLHDDVEPLVLELLDRYAFHRQALIGALEGHLGAEDAEGTAREVATVWADTLADLVVAAKEGDELDRYLAHGLRVRLEALAALEPEGLEALGTARRLSLRAGRDAARVGESVDRDGNRTPVLLTDELWVGRDLEAEVLGLLEGGGPTCVVVEGLPGMGKTSLLWRLHDRLRSQPEQEPLFVKASALLGATTATGATAPLLTTRDLRRAVATARRIGRRVTVMLDTVDVLLHTESGREIVLELIESAMSEGAAVVAACRGREARELQPVRTAARRLGSYGERELEDAVRRYVRRFYGEAREHDVEQQLQRLRGMVARRQPVGELLRTPLLMRMVFELYAPHRIPEELHAYRLFDQYWERRVRRDIRAEDGPPIDDTDLELTAGAVAANMLREGVPEVSARSLEAVLRQIGVDLAGLEGLIRRGVLERTELDTIAFFHQTFFEHAAGRWLATGRPERLRAARERFRVRSNDLFLAPVIEQALLASEEIDRVQANEGLRELFDGGPVRQASASAVYAHRRRVDEPLHDAYVKAVSGRTGPMSEVLLDVLPNVDDSRLDQALDVLRVLWRPASDWPTSIQVLQRIETLAARHPIAILRLLAELDPMPVLVVRHGAALGAGGAYVGALLVCAEHAREPAVEQLLAAVRTAIQTHRPGLLQAMLECLRPSGALDGPVCERLLETMAACASAHDERAVLHKVTRSAGDVLAARWLHDGADVMATASELAVGHADPALREARFRGLGGLIAAGADADLDALWALWLGLGTQDRFWFASQVWATVLSTDGVPWRTDLGQRLGDMLATPGGDDENRSAARTAFLAAQIEPHALVGLLRSPQFMAAEPWRDVGHAGRLLPMAARGGHPTAGRVLGEVIAAPTGSDRRLALVVRLALEDDADGDPVAAGHLLDLTVASEDVPRLAEQLRHAAVRWPDVARRRSAAVEALRERLVGSREPGRRRAGYRLWAALLESRLSEPPTWTWLRCQLAEEAQLVLPHLLPCAAILGAQELYEAEALVESLLVHVDSGSAATADAARHALARVLTARVRDIGLERAVTLLLAPPVAADRLAGLGRMLDAEPDAARGATVLVDVLRRAPDVGLPRAAQRDVAARLRKSVRALFRRCDPGMRAHMLRATLTLTPQVSRCIVEAAGYEHFAELAPMFDEILGTRGVDPQLATMVRRQKLARERSAAPWPEVVELF